MVDLIQSESICQIDLIRIGTIWIGMAANEKSYLPRLGQSPPLSVRGRQCDSSGWNSYGYGSYIANFSRFDSRAEKSEAWPGLRVLLNPNGGNEGIPMAT